MNKKKIVTRIWNWAHETKIWANLDIGGTDDVPPQIRKFIAKEVQKVITVRMIEIEFEAIKHGILYDINKIDEEWFMSPEEVRVIINETTKRLQEEES